MNRLSFRFMAALLCSNQVSARDLIGVTEQQALICSSSPVDSAAKSKSVPIKDLQTIKQSTDANDPPFPWKLGNLIQASRNLRMETAKALQQSCFPL